MNKRSKYSPEEILEIFKEQHRLVSPLDPIADETFELNKDTLLCDLQDAQDLLPWRQWVLFLNSCFELDVSQIEWKLVVKPLRRKRLWDVCVFISERANKIELTAITPASVFTHFKDRLEKRGADISGFSLSSSIGEFMNLENNFEILIQEVTLLGIRVFDSISYFETNNFQLNTGDIQTFDDLVNRIIERRGIQNKRNTKLKA